MMGKGQVRDRMEHDEALDRARDGYGNSRGLKEFSGGCGGRW